MLKRLLESGRDAEFHAFEAVDRCCREARADYLAALAETDHHRRLALRAVMVGDLAAAVTHTRHEGEAEAARHAAWAGYREAYALLEALATKTAEVIAPDARTLAATG